MYSKTPLLSGWTLEADELPEHLILNKTDSGFSLPGAEALADFSQLLGFDSAPQESAPSEPQTASFSLPGLLPEDVSGHASLSREIDFGALCASHTTLEITHLCGSGHIELGGQEIYRFPAASPDALLDLTDTMRLGRKQTLSICFDDAHCAGVCGPVFLKTTGSARFDEILLTPSVSGRTLDARITFWAAKPGIYAVRAAFVPDESDSPWRETRIAAKSKGKTQLTLSFSLSAPRFEAGKTYDAPVIKLELYALSCEKDKQGHLSDVRTLMTGVRDNIPLAYIPLTKEECRLSASLLAERAKAISAPALFLPAPASGDLYRRCTQEGIALMPYAPQGAALCIDAANSPCAYPLASADIQSFEAPSWGTVCAQLCSIVSAPPSLAPGISQEDQFFDAAGKAIDPGEPETAAVLGALRAQQIFLRAEAFRQGQYTGSLCAPGEWQQPSISDALRRALNPLHFSALPLRGAWWAQAHFSAALQVFIPEEERRGAYAAEAELLRSDGQVLASCRADCPPSGGHVGFLSAQLPDEACVLTLRTRLRRSGAIIETQELPVYVGLRGPLEAAFKA